MEKTALTLLNKLRVASGFCDFCQAAMLSLAFDDYLRSPRQDSPPELQEFLGKIQEMHEVGRAVFLQVARCDGVLQKYKEELGRVNLSTLVF